MRKSLTEEIAEYDDRADLIPMIDCVFLMLLFFVVTATFSDQTLFRVDLPSAAKSETRTLADSQVVVIAKDGSFALGDQLVSEDQLLPALRRNFADHAHRTLVIQGDKGCPYEKVVTAVDAAHALGVQELCLAVKQQ
jgi:biopolymer transport protein ExbD